MKIAKKQEAGLD